MQRDESAVLLGSTHHARARAPAAAKPCSPGCWPRPLPASGAVGRVWRPRPSASASQAALTHVCGTLKRAQ